jgi:hypothetical protein
MSMLAEDLRYPIGKFTPPIELKKELRDKFIDTITRLPHDMRNAVNGLTEEQLDAPYRDGGWTLRQVVHHVADSHVNAYIRFKLTLTEVNPTIKPYIEQRWAELPDSKEPVELSLKILEAIHPRWVVVLNHISDEEMNFTFIHPEKNSSMTLFKTMALYAWHSEHHLNHILQLRKRMKW